MMIRWSESYYKIERINKDPKFIEYMSDEEEQRKRINTMIIRATK